MAIYFFLEVNFGLFATVIQISLYYQTVKQNTGSLVSIPNKSAVSFVKLINGINSLVEVDRAM